MEGEINRARASRKVDVTVRESVCGGERKRRIVGHSRQDEVDPENGTILLLLLTKNKSCRS